MNHHMLEKELHKDDHTRIIVGIIAITAFLIVLGGAHYYHAHHDRYFLGGAVVGISDNEIMITSHDGKLWRVVMNEREDIQSTFSDSDYAIDLNERVLVTGYFGDDGVFYGSRIRRIGGTHRADREAKISP